MAGVGCSGWLSILNKVFRINITEQLRFEQSLEECELFHTIEGKSVQSIELAIA